MTEVQVTRNPGGPEQQQRRILSPREREIDRFERKIGRFQGLIPLDFLQTDAGSKLTEALQGARDFLTDSRRAIRGETTPLGQG